MLKIPVQATMRRNADGGYSMVAAEYIEVSADAFARFLIERFGEVAKCPVQK